MPMAIYHDTHGYGVPTKISVPQLSVTIHVLHLIEGSVVPEIDVCTNIAR